MPLPPADKPSASPADARPVILLRSPREAAAQAVVYRRRRAERPRDRGLRIAGIAGTLLVHLLVLFGAILGPAYDLPEPPHRSAPLQVRLIDKPEPPPPPPVRGTPPRRIGPSHRGTTSTITAERAPAALPKPAPAMPDTPVITVTAPKATVRIAPVAAPPPPLALPRPQPAPNLAPVPLAGTPPRINLDTPPTARPVPPKFQPEPVRKPQAEGNRPMPTPPSLAMPAVPVQAAPPVETPRIALDQVAPPANQPPSTVTLVRPQPAAAPATPQVEAIPLPAQAAPTINLAPQQLSAPTPIVPRERPRVQAPSIQLAEPQLAAVPLDTTVAPATPQAAAPSVEVSKVTTSPPSLVLARPETPTVAPQEPTPAESTAPAPSASEATAQPGNATAQESTPASAPEATPQGNDSGTPGARESATETTSAAGTTAPKAGQGRGQGEGRQGKSQPGAAEGAEKGRLGSYIQLKPSGDTDIMEHRAPDIGYKPTRFEDDWAPENESSLDTALRRAIDKTTVKKTFHLPRGVRVECNLSPLRLVALFGCGNPDPPAKAAKAEAYRRQYLGPARPLDPSAAASVAAAASAPAPAAPIHLDNAAQCAAARVSGGPLPPGCEGAPPSPAPAHIPPSSSSSWVPAGDQFQ